MSRDHHIKVIKEHLSYLENENCSNDQRESYNLNEQKLNEPKLKKKSSAYNDFVKRRFAEIKAENINGDPKLKASQILRQIAAEWKSQKE
jgi:hypothetical protein